MYYCWHKDLEVNQTTIGIIFTTKIEVGLKKLEEIKADKESKGIKCVRCKYPNNSWDTFIEFSDNELWKIVNPEYERDCKWNYAFIDGQNITLCQYETIEDNGLYSLEEPIYFNWDYTHGIEGGDE
nr:hypothetical protein [uncultured Lachnoclostridium sp.]